MSGHQGLWTIFIVFFAASGFADDSAPQITKHKGQPYAIKYDDNHILELRSSDQLILLNSKLTLSDNSCTQTIGNKAKYSIPVISRTLLAVWTTHPTKQGQPLTKLDTSSKKLQIESVNMLSTKVSDKNFAQELSRFKPQNSETLAAQQMGMQDDVLGWIECNGECKRIMPQASKILYWDENFETNNEETTMVQMNNSPSLNQTTSRLINLPVKTSKNKIVFGMPATLHGFSFFLPPGVSYQLQWNFNAPNLVDTDDQNCQLKWDVDFTTIFTQFVTLQAGFKDPDKFSPSSVSQYLYDPSDDNLISFSYFLQDSHWNDSEFRK